MGCTSIVSAFSQATEKPHATRRLLGFGRPLQFLALLALVPHFSVIVPMLQQTLLQILLDYSVGSALCVLRLIPF